MAPYVEERFYPLVHPLDSLSYNLPISVISLASIASIRERFSQDVQVISLRVLYRFFHWLLTQRQGVKRRMTHGVKSANALGTYLKLVRLVYTRAVGWKIRRKINWQVHLIGSLAVEPTDKRWFYVLQVSGRVAKKYKLTIRKRERASIDVTDLFDIL